MSPARARLDPASGSGWFGFRAVIWSAREGAAWAALLAVLGLANLFIALRFDFATWAWFISVGSIGAKLAAFALQYGVFRAIVRQRIAQAAM